MNWFSKRARCADVFEPTEQDWDIALQRVTADSPPSEIAFGSSSASKGWLSVFWYIDGEFMGHAEPLDGPSVVQNGVYLRLSMDHTDIQHRYGVIAQGRPLDGYPYGRIDYRIPIHQYVVFANNRITCNKELQKKLLDYFGLPQTTIFKTYK